MPLIIIGVIAAIYFFVIKPEMEKKKNNPPPSEGENIGVNEGVNEGVNKDVASAKYRAYQLGGFHGILQLVSDNIMSQRYV